MGRFIDEEELKKYIMHDGCERGCGYIDERDLKYIQTVEAIPKADYEARLKADMVAMLTDIQLEIEEIPYYHGTYDHIDRKKVIHKIQQKINALKAENKMN